MVDKEEKERLDQNYNTLIKHRYFLDRTRIRLATSFDKYLLTFATGSLGLSISFTNNLEGKLCKIGMIRDGWYLLIVSIISTMLSILISVISHNKQIKITDFKTKELFKKNPKKPPKNHWNNVIFGLELVGIFAFILGIISLSNFYYLNLKMANQTNQANNPKNGSCVIKNQNKRVGEMAPSSKSERIIPVEKGCSSNDDPFLKPKTK